jgi:hypothetical protein
VDWDHIDSTFRDINLLSDNYVDNGTYSVIDVNQCKPVVRNDDDDGDDDAVRNVDNVDLDNGSDDGNNIALLDEKDKDNDPHYGNMEDNHRILRSLDHVIAEDDFDITKANIPSIPFVLSIQYNFNNNQNNNNNNNNNSNSNNSSVQIQSAIEAFLKDNYAQQMSTMRNSTTTTTTDNDNNNHDDDGDDDDDDDDNNNHKLSLNSHYNSNDNITSYVECSHCNSMEIIHIKKLTELSSWRRSMMSRVKKQ